MKRDVDSQATHYWLKKPKTAPIPTKSLFPSNVHNESVTENCKNCPLPILLQGMEPADHVRLRYDLLQETWAHQQSKIESILQNANVELFNNLLQFISHRTNGGSDGPQDSRLRKFPVGFLQLGSNIANNLRIFKEFEQYLIKSQTDNKLNFRIVNLNSRSCANIKATIREIVKQVTTGTTHKDDEAEEDDEGEEEDDIDDDDEVAADDVDFDDEKMAKKYHGKISYDFDIIYEWCQEYFAKEGKELSSTNLRILIVIQDSDSLPNQLLNQVLKLIYAYSTIIPLKLVIGLSSINSNISTWLNNNLSNDLRIGIRGNLFKTVDNKMLGHSICNDLFLQYEALKETNSNDIPLVLSPDLIAIILNRFQNSNNSIDSLVSSFKLSYMIHFYQSPLPALLSKKFNQDAISFYINPLRKLPSFKRYIEVKVDQLSIKDEATVNTHKQEITNLLTKDEPLLKILDESFIKSKLERLKLINTTNILYCLQDRTLVKGFKEKIEIYQLLATRQIFSSLYLSNLFNALSEITAEQLHYITTELRTKIDENIVDLELVKFQQDLSGILSPEENARDKKEVKKAFLSSLKRYLKVYLVSEQSPLYEVFTIMGGSVNPPKVELLEDKSKNLIINLLRPELRSILENGLDDSRAYLSNVLVEKELGYKTSIRDTQPILTKLFQVYKDAPVNINIYDFYSAFRESFHKENDIPFLIQEVNKGKISGIDTKAVLDDLEAIRNGSDVKDEKWNKISFAWFLQGCFELNQMGIVKEKPKGDYLEKVIWKGV